MYDNMNARHRLDNVHAIMNLPSIRLVCPRAPRRARGKEGGGGGCAAPGLAGQMPKVARRESGGVTRYCVDCVRVCAAQLSMY